jgi:anti-sigma B factor antagonist
MTVDAFKISSHNGDPSTLVIEVQGEIDLCTAPELRDALVSALANGHRRLIVDLRITNFIDSSGLAVIFKASRAASSQDVALIVVADTDRVRRPFELSGMVNELEIVTGDQLSLPAPER